MKIKVKPLTMNQAYNGKRTKTDKYKLFTNHVLLSLKKMEIPDGDLELAIQIGVSNKNFDLDNSLKPFIDVLQRAYGFNDNRIYAITAMKRIVPKGEEFISFDLFECLKSASWEDRANHCEK